MSSRLMLSAGFAGLLLVACPGDETVGSGQGHHTEYNGPVGWAPVVEIGSAISGTITKQQFDLWGLDLRTGDELTITKHVTGGSLAPDFKLMTANAGVSSASHAAEEGKLTKTYKLTASGRYFLGVRAYQGQGEGSYSIDIACTGGPCAGGAIEEPFLQPHQANECIRIARQCAMDDMVQYNGAVGMVRARSLLTDCLERTSLDGGNVACTTACEGESATMVCETIIGVIPFYADQSEQCVGQFESCISNCYEYSDGNVWYDDGAADGPDFICAFEGLNGSCDSYAKAHEYCGGPNQHDSHAQCMDFCESSWGAWSDDLYGGCHEECGYQ